MSTKTKSRLQTQFQESTTNWRPFWEKPLKGIENGASWSKAFLVLLLLAVASSASAQTITGTVFKDNNGNGSRGSGELGLPGVIVTAFGATGTIAGQTASCGTAAISIPANPPSIPTAISVAACPVANVGRYTVPGLTAATPYRLESTWTDTLLFSGAQGSTSVQFADGGATGVNFGVNFPEDYCQNNPRILAGCYPLLLSPFGPPPWDPTRTDDLIVSWPYDTRFATATNAEVHTSSYTKDADYGDIGGILGVAVQRSTRKAFFSAVASPFWPSGSAGMGGIYTADYTGPGDTYVAASAGLFVDLDPLVDLTNQFPISVGVLDRFGEQGLGGIDFSADDTVLWAVNMGAGTLLSITVGDPPVAPTASEIQEITITGHGCNNGRFRPGPVVTRRGKVFVGGVCDASTGTLANLEAKVLEYDGATFTQRMTASLGFSTNQIFPLASFNMSPWAAGDSATAPQPLMTNMVFDDDGSLVFGLMPRVMYNTFAQTAGVMLRAQVGPSGNFTLENAATSGPYTSAAATTWSGSGFNGANPPLSEGPGGGYFFENGIFSGAFAPPPFVPVNAATYHPVLFSAGLTMVPGSGEVAAGFTDPVSINAFGVRILDRDDGTTIGGLQFGGLKVALVSEVDVVCQSPPLEIGNRVWCDTDVDGVQDPAETSSTFPAIDVVLTCGVDSPVTKTTGPTGRYLFTDADYIAINGTAIPRSASCTISIATSGTNGTALTTACGSTDLSPVDNGGVGAGSDLRDSDGAAGGGGSSEVSFNTGDDGENDHSYDFGFGALPVVEDWGDAPDSYSTTSGAGGPRHAVVANFSLGAAVDSESTGVPSPGADGDDSAGSPDDEDGVTFPGGMPMAAACEVTSITVELTNGASLANPQLDAWIDFNRDGSFNDPVEHLFGGTATALSTGSNVLPITVPCSAIAGSSYARFRLSNGEQLGPTGGPASAGEVEDYPYLLKADFGDAPDSYGTTFAANGPRHGVLPGFRLGGAEDAEGNGQPNAAANGDDVGAPGDDEDGITFGAGGAMATACSTGNPLAVVLDNTAGQANALLDAWIDWNDDGDFDHPAEHLFGGTSTALASGSNNLTYDVPCTAIPQAVSYARFRLSSTGGLSPLGASANGEIEDYTFEVKGIDFGDAPDTYGTTMAAAGARHTVIPGFSLGAAEDGEPNGQPTPGANGDDTNGTPDDEDGVAFPGAMAMAAACSTGNNVTVTLTRLLSGPPAQLDAWIDFNGDDDFDHPAEHLFSGASQVLAVGANSLSYDVPCNAVSQAVSYARFRLSTAGSLPPTGATGDGEVEDYTFQIKGTDFGDAPDTYSTTTSANGPSHAIVPGFSLGALEDGEPNGQPSPGADGDDTNGQGDEDGVTFAGDMAMAGACTSTSLDVALVNTASIATARLDAWIDWNGDGDFDHPAEHLFAGTSATLAAGANTLNYTVPCDVVPGASYARFRLSSAGNLPPFDATGGPVADGEVEDYTFQIKGVDLGDAPDTYGTTLATNGPAHTIIPGYRLGTLEDTESDGQPNAAADGDDSADEADEDGVTFADNMAMAGACTTGNGLTVDLTNTSSIATALLDAWIDWNGDGDFDHPAEHLFGGTTAVLSAGANALSYDVPCDAVEQAISYARFRLSSTGSLPPTDAAGGPVADGEVEDYTFQVKGMDLGDAPDTYGTTITSDGPRHTVIPGYRLGTEEDSEADGQPNATADGDDNTGAADEDGITFAGAMAMAGACTTGNGLDVVLTNTAGVATALLDAWVDWNGDGDFDHPAEHLFGGTSAALAAGPNALTYDVPCGAIPQAVSYARFRLSSTGGLSPTTPAAGNPVADGEVEDYTFPVKGVDFADAPDTYGTTLAVGGPSHTIIPGYSLGTAEDTEPDGQPNGDATGDDTDIDGDDEDGIAFAMGMPMAHACEDTDLIATLTNTAGAGAAFLDAWIDFNGDGDFDHPAEHLFGGTSAALAVGANSVTYTVPCDVAVGDTFSRFRLSSTGGLTPTDGGTGPVGDGEVEDYAFLLKGLDWGDAPAPYATTSADNGPWHVLIPTDNPTLGTAADEEADGQPSANHDGDDSNGTPDDEDGVNLPMMVLPGGVFDVDVSALNGGILNAWVDFNGNGVFGDAPAEQIATDLALTAGTTAIPGLVVPPTSPEGTVCARFRYSTQPGLGPTGGASDGEIEDYGITILPEDAEIGIAMESDPTTIIDNGDGTFVVVYTILLENSGNIPLEEVQAEKVLAIGFENAVSFTVDQVIASDNLTVNGGYDGDADFRLLSGTDILVPEEQGTIGITITVSPGQNAGPYFCSADVKAVSTAGTEVMDTSQDGDDPDPDDNGNPTDDNEPTPVVFDIFDIIEIPTLGEWGLALLALTLLLCGTRTLRRRRA